MKAGLGKTQSPFIKRLVRIHNLKWQYDQSKHVNDIKISRFNHMTCLFFFRIRVLVFRVFAFLSPLDTAYINIIAQI